MSEDLTALKEALAAERAKALEIAAELAVARAKGSEDRCSDRTPEAARIAKLERQIYGQTSERSSRLIDQLALAFEELEAGATEDELAAERAVSKVTTVRGFTRKRAERQTFPEHLPRERVVIDPPTSCECCGGQRLRKLGEDVTRTLECVPRQWKVVETVREKFSCRDCEKISQASAPFHAVSRGWAGASLLAMIMFEKFGQHQPLNRQAERYALEGVPVALSTMADAVGSVSTALDPLLPPHCRPMSWRPNACMATTTTVPVLAFKAKTVSGGDVGFMSGTTGRLVGAGPPGGDVLLLARPQGRASPGSSSPVCQASCRLMRLMGITSCTCRDARLGQSGRLHVGATRAGRFLPWPILKRTRAARPQGKRRSRCRRSRSRLCCAFR